MKYLLLIITCLMFAQPVLAARMVKGAVPQVQPLQPLPQGVTPNISNNIQLHDSSHAGQFFGTTGQNVPGSAASAKPGALAQPESASQKPAAPHPGLVVAVLLVLAAILGWWWFKPGEKMS